MATNIETPTTVQPSAETPTRIRMWRVMLLGLLLVPANVFWVITAEFRWFQLLTLNPLVATPIFYLFALVGINSLVRRFSPRSAFNSAELILLYIMLMLSCTVASHDFLINLMGSVGDPAWFATPENRWEKDLFPHIPKWLYVWDKDVLKGYYNGNTSMYHPSILKAWLPPLGFWSIMILSMAWMLFCMTVLLRKAWMEETRLAFPTVRLPLAMVQDSDPASIMRSKALWAGFALAAGLSLLNGMQQWFPNLPHLSVSLRPFGFTMPPWSSINWQGMSFYPFSIGLAYLVPLDISFSCWFGYVMILAQTVLGNMLGYSLVPRFPFTSEQSIGGWYAAAFLLLYASRRHLSRVFQLVWKPDSANDSAEPMSYRVAFWGLIVGMGIFFAFWYIAGMSAVWVAVVLLSFLLISMCIARV